MKIKNVKLPYPVLGLNDDIVPLPEFDIKMSSDKMKYMFDISFTMENPDIQKLLDDGAAHYVCEIDCVATYLRISKTSKTPRFYIELKRREVAGPVSFFCSIVTTKPIPGYKNSKAHSDYAGYTIDLNQGDLLAYLGEATYDAEIRYDRLQNVSTFMEIQESPLDDGKTYYVLSEPKILIQLPKELFSCYKEKVRGPKYASIIHASLAYNALLYALYNIDDYRDRLWARTLTLRLQTEPRLKGFDLDDPQDAPRLADELLGNPYKRMFDNIVTISNSGD
jgi:hypothetical protein